MSHIAGAGVVSVLAFREKVASLKQSLLVDSRSYQDVHTYGRCEMFSGPFAIETACVFQFRTKFSQMRMRTLIIVIWSCWPTAANPLTKSGNGDEITPAPALSDMEAMNNAGRGPGTQ